MNKMNIKKLMKNKKVVLVLGLILIVLGIMLIAFISDKATDSVAIYGNRLDGIEKVEMTAKKKKAIVENVKNTGLADSVKAYTQGKIINVEIKLKNDVSRDDSKNLVNYVMEKLTDEEKKFYDVQVFINKDNDEAFPIIGYRHHSKDTFSWTQDR